MKRRFPCQRQRPPIWLGPRSLKMLPSRWIEHWKRRKEQVVSSSCVGVRWSCPQRCLSPLFSWQTQDFDVSQQQPWRPSDHALYSACLRSCCQLEEVQSSRRQAKLLGRASYPCGMTSLLPAKNYYNGKGVVGSVPGGSIGRLVVGVVTDEVAAASTSMPMEPSSALAKFSLACAYWQR